MIFLCSGETSISGFSFVFFSFFLSFFLFVFVFFFVFCFCETDLPWPKASARGHLVHDVVPCFSVHSHPSCLCNKCHASYFYILFYAVRPSFGRSTLWSSAFQSGHQKEFGVSFLWHSFNVSRKPYPFLSDSVNDSVVKAKWLANLFVSNFVQAWYPHDLS